MSTTKTAQQLNLPEKLVQAAQDVIKILKTNNIPHTLIGGIAVGKYTKPRTTKDIDFLIPESSLDKVMSLFNGTSPLIMENRNGVTVNISGIDVDFILASDKENFVFQGQSDYHGFEVPGKEKLLYLKLDSDRTKDMSDIIEICKLMSDEEKNSFIKFLKQNKVKNREDKIEAFESCFNIAKLESKKASTEFRKMMLGKYKKG